MTTTRTDFDKVTGLRELSGTGNVLSLYLPLDSTPAFQRGYVALAKDALKDVTPPDGGRSADADAVFSYVESMIPEGHTLAVFSSTERGAFETFHLPVRLPVLARLAPQPFLAPIDAAMDDHPRVAVVAIGEREAKLLVTDLTEIQSEKQIHDDVPRRQRQGGWAAFRFEGDRMEHIRGHLRHVADELTKLHASDAFKRIVICASPEMASGFINEMSTELKARVVGTLAVAMYESSDAIVEAALAVADAAERKEEVDLVKEIRDLVGSGGQARLGWEGTVISLSQGRVHRLAISEGQLASAEAANALQLAWDTDARVEFLHGEAEELLAEDGGIGAILRY